MKTVSTTLLISLVAIAIACGYGKNYMTTGAALPVIAQLNPGSVTAGGPAFTMTVTGSNFASQAVVNLNGVAQTANTMVVNASQLNLTVPPAMIMNSGTIQVTVTNPAIPGRGMGGSGGTPAETSMPMNFTVD
jgi:hypothetical protein